MKSEYNVSARATSIETAPIVPSVWPMVREIGPVQPRCVMRLASQNQQYAAPDQISWMVVFHFAGQIAEMTTPRRAANCRNHVIVISRPMMIATTHHARS
jgi:hypothetical protein